MEHKYTYPYKLTYIHRSTCNTTTLTEHVQPKVPRAAPPPTSAAALLGELPWPEWGRKWGESNALHFEGGGLWLEFVGLSVVLNRRSQVAGNEATKHNY